MIFSNWLCQGQGAAQGSQSGSAAQEGPTQKGPARGMVGHTRKGAQRWMDQAWRGKPAEVPPK